VKCDNHEAGCSWTGSISDYGTHKSSCHKHNNRARRQRSDSDQELIDSLQQKNEVLQEELNNMTVKNAELEIRRRSLAMRTLNLKAEQQTLTATKDQLADELYKLKNMVKNCVEEPISDGKGGYAYDRFSVVKLTKLICQNIESKPDHINSNKIFECVRNIFMDLKKEWEDNPEHFDTGVRMLSYVCLGSAWFTENQHTTIINMVTQAGLA